MMINRDDFRPITQWVITAHKAGLPLETIYKTVKDLAGDLGIDAEFLRQFVDLLMKAATGDLKRGVIRDFFEVAIFNEQDKDAIIDALVETLDGIVDWSKIIDGPMGRVVEGPLETLVYKAFLHIVWYAATRRVKAQHPNIVAKVDAAVKRSGIGGH